MDQLRKALEQRELKSPDGLSRALLDLVKSEQLADKALLDVGCGWGRLTLALAPDTRRLIGIDRDERAVARARELALAGSFANVEFRVEDAESIDYRDLGAFDMVVSNLCMSDAIIWRASLALDRDAGLTFACFHTDQWKESGKVSSFAYDKSGLESVLRENGFRVEQIEVERDIVEFASMEEALWAVEGMKLKWEKDGRWDNYVAYLAKGGRQLTRSHLIVKARKR
ncbi:MAG TPA: class I SAM-dependent methyltransferase [Methylomirabilota bacterium]|nr:class I SAM-dependent methyltransferase [Methylomirabilota bacterium]